MTDQPDGLYIDSRGDVYRIRKGRTARAWRHRGDGTIHYSGSIRLPVDARLMTTLEEVRAAFPHTSPNCLYCGRPFTDATSKLIGIGPDCRRFLAYFDISHERIAAMRATGETRLDLAESNEDALARMARLTAGGDA